MTVSETLREGGPGQDGAISVRRMVNDYIAELATKINGGDEQLFDFMCECGDLRCRAIRRMTVAEFWATGPGLILGH